jgi:glutaredoxin 2
MQDCCARAIVSERVHSIVFIVGFSSALTGAGQQAIGLSETKIPVLFDFTTKLGIKFPQEIRDFSRDLSTNAR